jgi:hypothetical protein
MKKYLRPAASVALSLGLVFAIGAAASAHGGNHGGKGGNSGYGYGNKGNGHKGVVATGTTSCNFHGRLTISSSGAVRITGNITPKHGRACTSMGGTKLKTGHFSTALSSTVITTTTVATSTTTAACVTTPVPVGALANVSGGTISWSPRSKVAPSVGVALTGGTVSEVTVNGKQYVEIAYTGGSVASGSFAGTSGVSLTAWSNQTVSALNSECRNGSYSISFHGTLTL